MDTKELEQAANEICQQIIDSTVAFGECAVLLDENNLPHVLTMDELCELHKKYDLSQLEPINFNEIYNK